MSNVNSTLELHLVRIIVLFLRNARIMVRQPNRTITVKQMKQVEEFTVFMDCFDDDAFEVKRVRAAVRLLCNLLLVKK